MLSSSSAVRICCFLSLSCIKFRLNVCGLWKNVMFKEAFVDIFGQFYRSADKFIINIISSCEYLLVFFVISEFNVFGFWAAGCTKQDI